MSTKSSCSHICSVGKSQKIWINPSGYLNFNFVIWIRGKCNWNLRKLYSFCFFIVCLARLLHHDVPFVRSSTILIQRSCHEHAHTHTSTNMNTPDVNYCHDLMHTRTLLWREEEHILSIFVFGFAIASPILRRYHFYGLFLYFIMIIQFF